MAGERIEVTLDKTEWETVTRALGWCLADSHFTPPTHRVMIKAQHTILHRLDRTESPN